MPLIITKGLGPTSAYPACLAFTILVIGIEDGTIALTMSNNFTLSGPAADPSQYLIQALDSSAAGTVTAVTDTAGSLILTTTKLTNGGSYSITLPSVGLVDVNSNPFNGPFTIDFTAVATGPQVILARSIDARTLQIVFSEAVDQVSASDTANYSISPPLNIYAAVMVSASVYTLTTDRQTRDETYTVTVSNVEDDAGNPE